MKSILKVQIFKPDNSWKRRCIKNKNGPSKKSLTLISRENAGAWKQEFSIKKVFHPIVDDLVVDIKMTSSVFVCSIMKQTKLRMSIGNITGTTEGP